MSNKERLTEIKEEMKDLLGEAQDLFRQEGGMTYTRAKSYPLAHIAMALDKDHDYLGGSMFTFNDLIEELDDPEDEDCDEDDDDVFEITTTSGHLQSNGG